MAPHEVKGVREGGIYRDAPRPVDVCRARPEPVDQAGRKDRAVIAAPGTDSPQTSIRSRVTPSGRLDHARDRTVPQGWTKIVAASLRTGRECPAEAAVQDDAPLPSPTLL